MGWLLAAKTLGVPQATLRRHALGENKILSPNTKGLGRYKMTFSPDVERTLVEHLKFLEARLFGLTRAGVQELAFELAEKNGFAHKFNLQKGKAGQEWLDGFLRRNKDISLRKPEATSAARAMAFNKPQVQKFFSAYQTLLSANKFPPNRIYNMDESGLSTVHRPQQFLATTGRKQVGCVTSAERGTMRASRIHAAYMYVPPCMIFPRKNTKNELVDDAPTGTLGVAQESGWMTSELFVKWLKHFQSHVKASIHDKVLLILDGHASHKGLEALNFAKENGIDILCFPPHCTHRMQPLDVCFYGPLKIYFNQETTKWLKCHPGRVVTQNQVGYLFNLAYGKTATVKNACHGFKNTGLWPVDPDVFPDYMFEPAKRTNVPLTEVHVTYQPLPEEETGNIPLTTKSSLVAMTNQPLSQSERTNIPLTGESTEIPMTIQPLISPQIDTKYAQPSTSKNSLLFPVEAISPAPQGTYISGMGKRKPKTRSSHLVLTSTPNMEEIQAKNEPKAPPEKRRRKITKVLFDDDPENADFAADDDDDCPCIYCNDIFSRSKPGETWLRCITCNHWAHASCADVPKNTKRFICELCT